MVDKNSPIPMYYQLKEMLEELIKTGELKTGDRVYSENELCDKYEVSRITAKRALDEMVKEGYLYRLPGRGSFVQGAKIDHKLSNFYTFSEEVRKQGMVPSSELLQMKKIKANEEISNLLEIKKGEDVFYIQRLRKADGNIIALDNSYIPRSALNAEITREELENNSLYWVLTGKGALPIRALESFFAETLTKKDAALLGLDGQTAALKVCRKTYSNQRMIEYNFRYYKGHQYCYTVELK